MIIHMKTVKFFTIWAITLLSSCGVPPVALEGTYVPVIVPGNTDEPTQTPLPTQTEIQVSTTEESGMPDVIIADVLSVNVAGNANSYQFNVEISSPDTGCDQYSDWWEVLSEDGELIYRRVLLHSHVDEQPFTRSGGPVPIDESQVVLVRAHMNNGGYDGRVLRGSVLSGFEAIEMETGFATDVESLPPLPEGCAF